jgi:hypothetical protein
MKALLAHHMGLWCCLESLQLCSGLHHMLSSVRHNHVAPGQHMPCCTCLPNRDIPVSWFAARENAFNDPGHETVLHHGAGPFLEREKAQPRTVKRTAMDVNGYTIRYAAASMLNQQHVHLVWSRAPACRHQY